MMYFSGISSPQERGYLQVAGVEHVLADTTDWRHTQGFTHRVLDSGAYRAWKGGKTLDLPGYLGVSRALYPEQAGWYVAPDVIGDPRGTFETWLAIDGTDRPGIVPVWHWGADTGYLDAYLEAAPLVGIGALVPLMRAKDKPMLKGLRALAEKHPGRFHLFGCNWIAAINDLSLLVASIDTSKWLDAARYSTVAFINTRTGKLSQAPARCLGLEAMSRAERCIESARVMNEYCNQLEEVA